MSASIQKTVYHTKQQATRCSLFLVQKFEAINKPCQSHYTITWFLKYHCILWALGFLGIVRELPYRTSIDLVTWFFPHWSMDSTSVWQNGHSKLKIYFCAVCFVRQRNRECIFRECKFGAVWGQSLNRTQ